MNRICAIQQAFLLTKCLIVFHKAAREYILFTCLALHQVFICPTFVFTVRHTFIKAIPFCGIE